MTSAEIIAYIGAAAWLPQIGKWIYNSVAKSKLKIVSAPTVEIGYSTFGPIVNLTVAISVECRDALIEKITLKATHKKGEERHLTWKWLNGKQHQIQSATDAIAEVSKNQPAVALKVSTLSLAEKIECGELTESEDRKNPGQCRACNASLSNEGSARRNRCPCPACGMANSFPDPKDGPPNIACLPLNTTALGVSHASRDASSRSRMLTICQSMTRQKPHGPERCRGLFPMTKSPPGMKLTASIDGVIGTTAICLMPDSCLGWS